MANPGCDKIITYSDSSDIHIAWTEYEGGGGLGTHSFYIKFAPETQSWSSFKKVTDLTWDGGNNPDLTISANKVHYTYLVGGYIPTSRDKVKNSDTWEEPLTIPFSGSMVQYQKPTLSNNKLNASFRVYYSTYNYSGAFISNSDRPFEQSF